jgi:UDP-2,4-diacetamido-2,4,6-trideoxy-beta-L-altropyranose hydrolase
MKKTILCDYIEEKGFVVYRLPISDMTEQDIGTDLKHAAWLGAELQTDVEQVEKIIKGIETQIDWLVVDHYALDKRWESHLRKYVKKILVIDDIADRSHDCDILLDQTYGRYAKNYLNLIPESSNMLLGTQFALLRPQFKQKRQVALKLNNRCRSIRNIMVSMGGTDPENITSTVLKGLKLVDWINPVEINVILSERAPFFPLLRVLQLRVN